MLLKLVLYRANETREPASSGVDYFKPLYFQYVCQLILNIDYNLIVTTTTKDSPVGLLV